MRGIGHSENSFPILKYIYIQKLEKTCVKDVLVIILEEVTI